MGIPLPAPLRRTLGQLYHSASSFVAEHRLRHRSGPRRFDRTVIVAPLDRHNGIANGARLQYAAMRSLGLDVELLNAGPALRNPFKRVPHRPGTAYVFHCGGPQTALLLNAVLPEAADAYRIAYWAWELPDPPHDWGVTRHLVQEIWTPSEFSRRSLARRFPLPMHVVPHHIPSTARRGRDAAAPFTVLAMADSRSSFARKNPVAAVRAFQEAFPDGTARLLLKLNGREEEVAGLEARLQAEGLARNVTLVRGFLDDAGLDALYRSADVLLSLHRAEGFGLPMAEAMARGIPVVGTGWSGNLEFMHAGNSALVPYHLVPVQDEAGIYSDSSWAEPDIAAAAASLRRLAQDHAFYEQLADAAHASMTTAPRMAPGVLAAPAQAEPSFPLSSPLLAVA